MNGYLTAMRRYVDFSGRSSRSEFWFYVLIYIIIYIVAAIIDAFVFGTNQSVGILTGLVMLAHIVPSIAVSVRRLHDIDRTGWWVLVFFLAPFAITAIGMFIAGGSIFAMMSGQDTAAIAGFAGLGAAFMLILLADLVILIVALVFYCTRGTQGPNQYGPAPA